MADSLSDVVVIGAGPAGSAAARLLALWGHNVTLIERERARRPALAESLPPSCRKLFRALDVLDDVDAAGFIPCHGNSSAWGGGELHSEPFQGESGWQVVRDRLDELLLSTARAAGARVVAGTVEHVVHGAEAAEGTRVVDWRERERSGRIRARWVLDCSGRAGVIARGGFRRRTAVPPTVALMGVWRTRSPWPLQDDSHTVVESYDDGWAWSVPVAADTRYVAAMVDPQRTPLARGSGIDALYTAELSRTRYVRELLGAADLVGAAWACSAATYDATRYALPGALLVGDAGSFIDPLSSAGVKKALASAYLASVVVNTCLTRSPMTAAALALFDERERTGFTHYSGLAAQHYARGAQHHDRAFWHARAARAPGSAAAGVIDIEHDPRVRAAFETLRRDPRGGVRPAPRLERVQRATVVGREVVFEDHLASPAAPAGVRYFRGVDLPALLDVAAEHADIPALFEAYGRVRPATRLPEFVGAVSALVALGMLERTGSAEPATVGIA